MIGNKKEFTKNLTKYFLDLGFEKYKDHIYYVEKADYYIFVDLQKSNYDSTSYYINYGYTVKTADQFELTTKYPRYDICGRFIFVFHEKQTDNINFDTFDYEELDRQLNANMEEKINPVFKKGLRNFIKDNPELLNRTFYDTSRQRLENFMSHEDVKLRKGVNEN